MQIHSYAWRGDVAGIARELEKGVSIEAVPKEQFRLHNRGGVARPI